MIDGKKQENMFPIPNMAVQCVQLWYVKVLENNEHKKYDIEQETKIDVIEIKQKSKLLDVVIELFCIMCVYLLYIFTYIEI